MQFTFKNVRLVNTDKEGNLLKKWYVSYTISYLYDQYPDYPIKQVKDTVLSLKNKKYPKIYGSEYEIKLNDITDPSEKLAAGCKLERMIKKSLSNGIDPRLVGVKAEQQIEEEAEKSKGINYDEAIKVMTSYHGWENPSSAQRLTADRTLTFFNFAFRRYITEIKKLDDVSKITADDIKFYISRHLNPNGATYLYPLDGISYKISQWSYATAKGKVGVINYLFKSLVEKGKITTSPCTDVYSSIKKPKKNSIESKSIKKNKFEIWTSDELERLHQLGSTDEWLSDYTLSMITYHSYLRNSEILRMKLSMVDLNSKRFVIPSDLTKSHNLYGDTKYLYIKIPGELLPILDKYIQFKFGSDLNPDYFLFPDGGDNTKEYDYFQYKNDYKNRFESKLKVDKNQYALKHTGVTNYFYKQIEKGVNISVITNRLMKKCRHTNFAETMRYLSLDLGLNIDDEDDDE